MQEIQRDLISFQVLNLNKINSGIHTVDGERLNAVCLITTFVGRKKFSIEKKKLHISQPIAEFHNFFNAKMENFYALDKICDFFHDRLTTAQTFSLSD